MQTLQIKGRKLIKYTIDQGGIIISTYHNPSLPTEEHIPFENIRNDRFFHVEKTHQYLIVGALCFVLLGFVVMGSIENKADYLIQEILLGVMGALFVSFYFFIRPAIYFIKTFKGRFIKFKVSKNEAEIDAFVKEVFASRDEYVKLKYGEPTIHISYDAQFSNFNIMIKEKIITTDEYKQKIDALNNLFNQTAPGKTFGSYSAN